MDNPLIIGIDGGASKISGYVLEKLNEQEFRLTDHSAHRTYRNYPEFNEHFKPVELTLQLDQFQSGNILCLPEEFMQARVYQKALVDVISELLSRYPGKKAILGIGMPGLKTSDQRGIAVLANGPRIPELGNFIEKELAKKGVELLTPIKKLGSDADYCGIGEEYARDGMFKSAENAYYLGGGTGVADALKVKGKLLPFDQTKNWMPKSWEMANREGTSLEKFISARGIQIIYAKISGSSLNELDQAKIFGDQILKKAIHSERAAINTLNELSFNLARLIFSRITTLFMGWQNYFNFVNPARPIPEADHPYIGTLLDQVVIGQRLGNLLDDSKATPYLFKPMVEELGRLIKELNHPGLNIHYIIDGHFDDSLIKISKLREAPVIGAGVDAYLNYKS